MAKALVTVGIAGPGQFSFQVFTDDGQTTSGAGTFTIPNTLTPTIANNFIKDTAIAIAQSALGVTLIRTDITLIGGAV